MKELTLSKVYKLGDNNREVRLIQEWLCLNGMNVTIDGDFGPATQVAVRRFQDQKRLDVDGQAGPITYTALVQPLKRAVALDSIDIEGLSLPGIVVKVAQQHLQQKPREVGGQNKGPWVRLYCNRQETLWCAGFVSYVLEQACDILGRLLPFNTSLSCDSLASNAKTKGLFVPGSGDIKPGYIFLQRRSAVDWVHTGIVIAVGKDYFESIEGNTNDAGDREGYEVCKRIRGFGGKDFIKIV